MVYDTYQYSSKTCVVSDSWVGDYPSHLFQTTSVEESENSQQEIEQ